jgi:hypothetical protein
MRGGRLCARRGRLPTQAYRRAIGRLPRLCAPVTRCTVAVIRKTRKRVAMTAPGRAIRGRLQPLVDSAARLVQGRARGGDRRRCGPMRVVDAMGKGRQVGPRSGQPRRKGSCTSLRRRPSTSGCPPRPFPLTLPRSSHRGVRNSSARPPFAGRACHDPVRGR